jgi:hypothetical protein
MNTRSPLTGVRLVSGSIVIQGIIRCDDVYLTGGDNDQTSFSKTLFVQYGVPVFNVTTGSWDFDTSAGQVRLTENADTGFSRRLKRDAQNQRIDKL